MKDIKYQGKKISPSTKLKDIDFPEKLIIKNSLIIYFLMLFSVLTGIALIYISHKYVSQLNFIILTTLMVLAFFLILYKALNRKPILEISNKGIITRNNMYTWKEIKDIGLFQKYRHRDNFSWRIVLVSNGKVNRIVIRYPSVAPEEIARALLIYRSRSK